MNEERIQELLNKGIKISEQERQELQILLASNDRAISPFSPSENPPMIEPFNLYDIANQQALSLGVLPPPNTTSSVLSDPMLVGTEVRQPTEETQTRPPVTPIVSNLKPVGITPPQTQPDLPNWSGTEAYYKAKAEQEKKAEEERKKAEEKRKKALANADFKPGFGYEQAAHMLGRSIAGAETVGAGIVGGAKIGLGLTREIMSGIGTGNLMTEAEKERRKQRPLFEGIFQDGGRIPLPQELTGQYVQGGNPTDVNPEIANIEGGEYMMQEDGQIQEAIGPSHEEGGIPLTREEVPLSAEVLSDDLEIGKEGQAELKEIYPNIKFHFKDTYSTAFEKVEKSLGVDRIIEKQEEITKDIIYQEENVEGDTADLNTEHLMEELYKNQMELDQLQALRQAAFEVIYEMQQIEKGEDPELEQVTDELQEQMMMAEMMGMQSEPQMQEQEMMGFMDEMQGDGTIMAGLPMPQEEQVPLMRRGGIIKPKVSTRQYRDSQGNLRSYTIDKTKSNPKILRDGGSTEESTTLVTSNYNMAEHLLMNYRFTSPYGDRFDTIKYPNQHRGIDLVNINNDNPEVRSIFEGKVVEVTKDDKTGEGYGNTIVVQRNDGTKVRYAHLDSITPELIVGKDVKPNDLLGIEGETGKSDGRHLHIEIEGKDKEKLNPAEYIANAYDMKVFKEGRYSWRDAMNYLQDKTEDQKRQYIDTIKNEEGLNVEQFNRELMLGLAAGQTLDDVIKTAISKNDRLPTQRSNEVAHGSFDTIEKVNDALTRLYIDFPQAIENLGAEVIDIQDGRVTLNDGISLNTATDYIGTLQGNMDKAMVDSANYILNRETSTEAEKQAAREFLNNEIFLKQSTGRRGNDSKAGEFTLTRTLASIGVRSPEVLKYLNDAGIVNTRQVSEETLKGVKGLTEEDKVSLLEIVSTTPEGVYARLDYFEDSPDIGDSVPQGDESVDTSPEGDVEDALDTPGGSKGESKTTPEKEQSFATGENISQAFTPQWQVAPSGIQAPQRHSVQFGRMSPEYVGTDAQMAEIARQESFGDRIISSLPPAQRAAAESELRAQGTQARLNLLGDAEARNAQARLQAQQTNIQLASQEQQANIQLDQDYEQKMFQTQAIDEANWRNYYNALNEAERVARLDTQNLDLVNQAYSNFYTDSQGRILEKGTNKLVMTREQAQKYRQQQQGNKPTNKD